MDTGQVLALANKYNAAAEEVEASAHSLKSSLNVLNMDWSGKGREAFNAEFEETLQAFKTYAEDCRETSEQLRGAAARIEQINEQKRRMEELEKQALHSGVPTNRALYY